MVMPMTRPETHDDVATGERAVSLHQPMENILDSKQLTRWSSTPVRTAREVGQLVKKQRQALGYGLVEAAALCQVGTRFLFELEKGKATVEFDRTLRVTSRLGIAFHMTLPGP